MAGLGSVRKVKNCDVRDGLKEISYLWMLAIRTRVRALLRDGRRVREAEATSRRDRELEGLGDQLSDVEGVQWHFSPTSSPHFGGTWVRFLKHTSTKVSISCIRSRKVALRCQARVDFYHRY